MVGSYRISLDLYLSLHDFLLCQYIPRFTHPDFSLLHFRLPFQSVVTPFLYCLYSSINQIVVIPKSASRTPTDQYLVLITEGFLSNSPGSFSCVCSLPETYTILPLRLPLLLMLKSSPFIRFMSEQGLGSCCKYMVS